MNKLINGLTQTGTTANGGKAHLTTQNNVLDLFFMAGASRGRDITVEFNRALGENFELTCQLLLWLRDARGGAGERQQFKDLMLELINVPESFKFIPLMIKKIPELGRFDDLLMFMGTKYETNALEVWKYHLQKGNGLAFKWAPRKDSKGGKPLRLFMGYNTEKAWRKYVVPNTKVVEQQMCAKDWDINFSHVPSLAMSRYSQAFNRNNEAGFQAFKDAVKSGDVKINTSAVYPYDVTKTLKQGDVETANIMWDNLPNYIPEGENVITVVDTSASMTWGSVAQSTSVTAKDVAISLGLYTSERLTGAFKDAIITFSSRPTLQVLKGTLQQRMASLREINSNTNLALVFEQILNTAVLHKVPAEDMPTKVLIISDMQFDSISYEDKDTVLQYAKSLYLQAGYEMPQLIFWNVKASSMSFPSQANENNTLLISGFSPSILGDVLQGHSNPVEAMLEVLMKDKYKLNGE